MAQPVLLIEPDPVARERLASALRASGYVVRAGEWGECAVVHAAGIDDPVVAALLAAGTPVVATTAGGALDEAVRVLARGAFGYVPRDDADAVCAEVAKALRRATSAQVEVAGAAVSEGVVGRSEAMVSLYGLVARAASSDVPVLVLGETGAGKEWVARAVHRHSRRRTGPFIAVNCASLAPGTLESELFGHARGSFTGATSARRGLFQSADGGSIFLDEVAELPPRVQAELLRVIQSGEVRPVGSEGAVHVDVRILAATHRDMDLLVERGSFRRDLLYRLRVITLEVPPLRERPGDIPALAEYFLSRAQSPKRLAVETLEALAARPWRGNVRELRAVIERAAALAPGPVILPEDVADEPERPPRADTTLPPPTEVIPALEASLRALLREGVVPIAALEEHYVRLVVELCEGNKSLAAERLGVDRKTIRRILTRGAASDEGDA